MQNVQTAPKLCLGLPEGVCDTSKGAVGTEQKGIHNKKSPFGLFYIKMKLKKLYGLNIYFPFLFALCAYFTFPPRMLFCLCT